MKYHGGPRVEWLVNRRDLILLMLFGWIAFGLCVTSLTLIRQSHFEIRRAQTVVARADSLVAEWAARGCTPRTKRP